MEQHPTRDSWRRCLKALAVTGHRVHVRPVRRSDSEDELLGSLTVAVHANRCSVDCRKVKDEVLKWLCFSSALFFSQFA